MYTSTQVDVQMPGGVLLRSSEVVQQDFHAIWPSYKLQAQWVGMMLKGEQIARRKSYFFSALALMIRFPAAIFTCCADDELTFMGKHLFLADRDGDVFVMGDVQCPDGGN